VIVLGNRDTLESDPNWKKYLEFIDKYALVSEMQVGTKKPPKEKDNGQKEGVTQKDDSNLEENEDQQDRAADKSTDDVMNESTENVADKSTEDVMVTT